MRIPAKVSSLSTSIILALAALSLLLVPVQMVQTIIYQRGAPYWYPAVIIGTLLLRAFISYGLFQRKSWALLLYSLDKILFLSLYGMRYIQAETLPYTVEARQALVVPAILTGAKLVIALLAYREFTPNFTKHFLELWQNWRKTPTLNKIFQEIKADKIIRIALGVYFALTLGSQVMGQLYRTILLWANPLQAQFPWLKLSLFLQNDNFWVILPGSIAFSALAVITSLRRKTWGWKLILVIFFFAFILSLPKELRFMSTQQPQNFWIRRSETLLSFLWLGSCAFWLAQPQKGKLVLGKKRK